MLAIPQHHGSICTRCALRLRLLDLQRQRRPKSTFTRQDADDKIRYTPGRGYEGMPRAATISDDKLSKLSGGLIRRHLKGDRRQEEKQNFKTVLMKRIAVIKDQVKDAPVLAQLAQDRRELDGKKEESFSKLWINFTQKILQSELTTIPYLSQVGKDTADATLWEDLVRAWRTRGQNGLDDRIKYAFYGHVTNSRFTESDIKNQVMLADLRYPSEWFPATRQMQRTIHLHVGPTNSGKTFQALQRLEQANAGCYAGPLRLLAHEVFTRMNAKGKKCALITGEERRRPDGDDGTGDIDLSSCTVEMIPLNREMDVAVIDEIQMIGNPERGWAWTQAVLGVKAREVHLCGEARTVPLIRELCASVGEKLEVHEYKRLSPLQMADDSLGGDLKKLRKGDCIVSFSVMGIHALRREIEKATQRKVAIVYGSLPPETRAQQARLFNDPNNDYDYLVASDAVGMGLNLAIKRIIFETSSKFDGIARRTLSIADIKQIGGRAGRFRTSAQATEAPLSEQDLAAAKGETNPNTESSISRLDDTPVNVGLVTTLERFDFPIISTAMQSEPEPIQTAGIFPPAPVLERFSNYFPPGTPFSYVLTRLHELSQMHKRFHLCGLKDQIWVADIIEPVQGLTIADRNNICSAPASKGDSDLWSALLPAYARCIAQQSGGSIIDIQELPLETLEAEDVTNTKDYLRELERLHKGIVTYLWLSYRFAGIFNTRALAFHVKGLVEQKIEHVLGQISFSETQRKKLAKAREKEILRELMNEQQREEEAETKTEQSSTPTAERETALDADEAAFSQTLAGLAKEEPSAQTEVHKEPEEATVAERLMGDTLKGPDDPADGGSFSGEPYLELEEEPEVERIRTEETDGTAAVADQDSFSGESAHKPDVKEARAVEAEDDSIDPETIIEDLTGHKDDAPRRPNTTSSTRVDFKITDV